MEILTIRRFVPEYRDVMLGVFLDPMKRPFAVTLEHPWKQNAPYISCIPTGENICRRYSSEKYPNVWEICNVKGRSKVLIHWGNFLKDTEGCVIVGENFQDLNGDGIVDIGGSKSVPNQGFNELMSITKDFSEFKLVIEQPSAWEI